MKEITVNFDKKKRIKILLFGVLIVLVCLAVIYGMIRFSESILTFYFLVAIVITGVGIFNRFLTMLKIY